MNGFNALCIGGHPSLSANGRFVAFHSDASNLVRRDTNCQNTGDPPCTDVFVHDRVTGTTERASVSSGGRQANDVSSDPTISADGRFVYFQSAATNLVPGVARHTGGVFVGVFVHDRLTGRTTRIIAGYTGGVAFSPGGRFLAFDRGDRAPDVAGCIRGSNDLFLRDRLTGKTELVSVARTGGRANCRSYARGVSADGRLVLFDSEAANLVSGDTNVCRPVGGYGCSDIFLRDRATRKTALVSVGNTGKQGNGESSGGSMSSDGRFVAFASGASNLVPGATDSASDIFLRDRTTRTTTLISRSR
jgi:Tol biopolymer transport system component